MADQAPLAQQLIHVPELYQQYHAFLDLAEKILVDTSHISRGYVINAENPLQQIRLACGPDARILTTECAVSDFIFRYGESAILANLEFLECVHGLDPVPGDECIQWVLRRHNGERVALATVDLIDLANEVTGLPVIAPAAGAEALVYQNASAHQVTYAIGHNAVEREADMHSERAWARSHLKTLKRRAKNRGIR